MACGQIMFIIINVFISWLQDRMTSDDNDSIVQWSEVASITAVLHNKLVARESDLTPDCNDIIISLLLAGNNE